MSRTPYCDTTIVGTLQPQPLAENVAIAMRGPPAADVNAEARRRLDGVGEVPQGA